MITAPSTDADVPPTCEIALARPPAISLIRSAPSATVNDAVCDVAWIDPAFVTDTPAISTSKPITDPAAWFATFPSESMTTWRCARISALLVISSEFPVERRTSSEADTVPPMTRLPFESISTFPAVASRSPAKPTPIPLSVPIILILPAVTELTFDASICRPLMEPVPAF